MGRGGGCGGRERGQEPAEEQSARPARRRPLGEGGKARTGAGQPRGLGGRPAAPRLTSLPSAARPAPRPGLPPAPCPARPCRLLRGGGVGVGDEDPLLALRRTEPSLGLLGVSWLHPRTPAPRKGSRASAGGGARLSGSPLRPPRPAPRSPPRTPQWPRPRANPHDLPSRWEQHKESTFHAPHQAHAERLRVLKNSL